MKLAAEFDLDTLLPQRRGMRLLDRVLAHDDQETRCEVRVADSRLFAASNGSVPSWVALEYMAQCTAVRGGLARGEDGLPKLGVLAGCRKLSLRCTHFEPEDRLEVRARSVGRLGEALAFACDLRRAGSGEVLAEGRLQVSLVAPDRLAAGGHS